MALLPGTRLGAYEIVGPIGAGGMGEVYRARDPRLDRDVAIKILPERSSSNRSAVARLQIEARAASALNHPNILTVHEIGHIDGDPPRDYIVTEFIEGLTLRDYLAKRPELDDLLELLIQIGDGLAKAHEAHIVHRDLKPENIMVTTDGYAKILDFGLAKVVRAPVDTEAQTEVAPLSVAGALLGTIGYLAPEQIGNAHVDARADIFPSAASPTRPSPAIAHSRAARRPRRCSSSSPPIRGRCAPRIRACRPNCRRSSAAAWRRTSLSATRR